MGTNFYYAPLTALPVTVEFADGESQHLDVPRGKHIGKRSAAGWFCWDCGEALCEGGNAKVHYGTRRLDACPKCGKTRAPAAPGEALSKGAAAVELGFAKPNEERPMGVDSTSSFSWAIDPYEARAVLEARLERTCVVDEYGRTLTGAEFLKMLRCQCGIEFTHSVGREFS